jgi:hypothetical protein
MPSKHVQNKKKNKKELKGIIAGWFETGQEGYVWAFYEDGKKGWDGFNILEAGDHLKIFSEGGLMIFSNIIEPDRKVGRQTRPGTKIRQPAALGYWIHWTQKGFSSDDWAKFFFSKPPFRAILRKK